MPETNGSIPRWQRTGRVTCLLNDDETQKLVKILEGDIVGLENPADFVRLMIHREHNRRHRLPKPKASDWQGSFRKGRPAET